jgi:DNA polymerase-3 subunit delta
MIIKYNELKSLNKNNFNFYLFYGSNKGLIEETINKNFKSIFTKNISSFDEAELLNNIDDFKEMIFNKSFFDDEKFIIINRASGKIVNLIQELVVSQVKDLKIIITAGVLEKKSKLRNFFEKDKFTIIVPFYEDNYQSLATMIQTKFRENKINVSNEIINLLVDRSKGDRINIYNEIEKILSYNKNKTKINLEDVLKLTNLAENHDISELVDHSLSKNIKKTLNIINENNPNTEENILIIRVYLSKLRRLKKLKIDLEKNKNIENVLSSSKPPIFWKDKDIIKQQLSKWTLKEIRYLIHRVNKLELKIKKNNQISNHLLNNFILENLTVN